MKKALFILFFVLLKISPSLGIDIKKTDNILAAASSKNCKIENHKLLSFPDIYHSQYDFGACEIAFVNNPKKYAKIYYHYLRSFAYYGRVPNQIELKFVDEFYLQKYPSHLILNHKPEIQNEILKSRALSGDASALMTLTTWENYSLNNEQVLKLSRYEDIELLQLLFLDENEITQIISDWKVYEKYIKHFNENLHRLSSYFRDKIAEKLINLSLSISAEKQHAPLFVQSLPFEVATNLLTLTNFVSANLMNEKIYWSLIIRLYSPREKRSIYELGIKKQFYEIIKKNIDLEYYNHLINLKNMINGNEVYGLGANQLSLMTLLIIQNIERKNPNIRDDYIKYFPLIKKSKILEINPIELQSLFINHLKDNKGLDELEKKLLVSDIKVLAKYPYILDFKKDLPYLEFINYQNKTVKKLINSISNPLENLSFYVNNSIYYDYYDDDPNQKLFYGQNTKKLIKENKLKSFELIKNIKKYDNKICNKFDKETCKLLWRGVSVGNLGYGAFLKNASYRISYGKECLIKDNFDFFVKKMAKNGAVISELFGACSYKKLQKILDLNNDVFFKKIPYYLTSLGFTGGKAFSTSEDLIVKGGGMLATALHQSRFDNRIIRIPTSKKSLGVLNETKSSQFISYINSLNFPTFSEKEFGYIDYAALSQFYKYQGNYERALRSAINYFEENIREGNKGDISSQILALHDLSIIKNLLRNLNTPDELINIYLRSLYEKVTFDYNKIKIDNFDTGLFKIKGDWVKSFTKNYLNPNKKIKLETYLDSFNQKNAFLFVGTFLGLSLKEQQRYCENREFREKLIKILKKLDKAKTLGVAIIGIDAQHLYEFQNISNYCYEIYFDELILNKQKKLIEEEFNFRVDQGVIKGADLNFNYTDPRNLLPISIFSLLSKETKSLQGTLLSLTVLKHTYEKLAKSFLLNNSNSLRIKQKIIENIIINISSFLKHYEPKNKNEIRIYKYLKSNLDMLESSSKILITSDSTRKRYLSLIGSAKDKFQNKKIKESFSYKNYLKLKNHFNKIDKELKEKDNIIDVINTKAKYPDHGQFFFRDFYSSFNNLNWIKDQKVIKDDLIKIISISSSNNKILISFVSDDQIYERHIFNVNKNKLNKLKNSISNKSYLYEDDLKLGCYIFSEIHENFDFSSYEFLAAVPSVNLFPIPLSIVLGTACKQQNIPIIYTSDISSSSEFVIFGNKKSFPDNFVGVGNPIITEDTFEIEIPGLTNSNVKRKADLNNEFTPLPDASEEILRVGKLFKNKNIFLEENASISKALKTAESKNYSAIVLATHGVPFDLSEGYKLPSLLSIENDTPTLLSATKINEFDLKQSTVFLSACDTASGLLSDPSLYLTGFTESFANAGSNLIIASLWPVVSKSSKNYSINFFQNWKDTNLINGIKAAKNSINKDINKLPFITVYP